MKKAMNILLLLLLSACASDAVSQVPAQTVVFSPATETVQAEPTAQTSAQTVVTEDVESYGVEPREADIIENADELFATVPFTQKFSYQLIIHKSNNNSTHDEIYGTGTIIDIQPTLTASGNQKTWSTYAYYNVTILTAGHNLDGIQEGTFAELQKQEILGYRMTGSIQLIQESYESEIEGKTNATDAGFFVLEVAFPVTYGTVTVPPVLDVQNTAVAIEGEQLMGYFYTKVTPMGALYYGNIHDRTYVTKNEYSPQSTIGYSGGLLLNQFGQIVGILTGTNIDTGDAYVVPISTIQQLFPELFE